MKLIGLFAIPLSLVALDAAAYGTTANLTFTFGGSVASPGADQAFVTSVGPISVPGLANGTMFSQLAGANSQSYYNPDFATSASCVPGAGIVPSAFTVTAARNYG